MGFKLTITDAAGKVAVLAEDGTDLARSGFSCNGQRAVDVQGRLRADFVAIFDRNNRVKNITFQTQKVHTDAFDAILFAIDHDDAVPTQGLIELEISDGERFSSRWFPNAAVTVVNIPRQHGASTWQQYQIVAGQTLTKNPNT